MGRSPMMRPMLRLLTAGESHGKALVGVLEGLPAGVPFRSEDLGHELARLLPGEVTALARAECDLSNPDQIVQATRRAKPHLIVNAAGDGVPGRIRSAGPAILETHMLVLNSALAVSRCSPGRS